MKGEQGFHHYYEDIFGSRWEGLRDGLRGEPAYLEVNRGLLQPYYMDLASVVAASLLPLPAQGAVLDMCAAPGGKTLVLARRLFGGAGVGGATEGANLRLVANERSSGRRARLHRVLRDHLPEGILRHISVTGHDATKWGLYEQEAYDAILCDVPCSSERHVLSSPEHLKHWSPNRVRSLAIQAVGFVAAACDALRPGGFLLYCTCSLTEDENDAVVARLLKRRQSVRVVAPDRLSPPTIPELEFRREEAPAPFGAPTTYGRHVLPDAEDGAGPLYFALLTKGLH